MNPTQKRTRRILLILSILGVLISGFILSLSFMSENQLRQSAKAFVKHQVIKEARERYGAAQDTRFGDALDIVRNKMDGHSEVIQDYLENRMEDDISELVDIFCTCETDAKETGERIREYWTQKNQNTSIASDRLNKLVSGRYQEIIEALRRDIRIFSGTNLCLFLIAILALTFKSRASVHLVLPVTLLLLATLTATTFYIFGQNWFYTIIFSNYWGFGYSVLAGVIFLFLMDVVFNKGRVTAQILNAMFQALGKAITIVPC